jgi:dolichol kinase
MHCVTFIIIIFMFSCTERHYLILCHARVLYEATWPVHNYVCVCVRERERERVCVSVCLIKLTVVPLRAEYLLV